MKDQVIRARTLIFGLHASGLIPGQQSDRDVLVIGGGIGGVSAALAACELGYTASVIEPSQSCFPLLAKGSDRLFSATVYDWPHPHFANHVFPLTPDLRHSASLLAVRAGSPALLEFPSRPANGADLRSHLLDQLDRYADVFGGQLEIRHGSKLRKLSDVSSNETHGYVVTKISDEHENDKYIKSSVVIFALGFGLGKDETQRNAVADFFSYKTLEQDVKLASAKGFVEIVGAGDGGLQEALRFALKPKFHDLTRPISQLANAISQPHWSKLVSRIISAEDQAVKSAMWGFSEDLIYRELHDIYAEEIERLVSVARSEMVSWRDMVLRENSFEIRLVDPCEFSMKAYPLNRFLIMLIERCALAGSAKRVSVVRVRDVAKTPGVRIKRFGFAGEGTNAAGTASKEDLLRRIAFRAIPMSLDSVV